MVLTAIGISVAVAIGICGAVLLFHGLQYGLTRLRDKIWEKIFAQKEGEVTRPSTSRPPTGPLSGFRSRTVHII